MPIDTFVKRIFGKKEKQLEFDIIRKQNKRYAHPSEDFVDERTMRENDRSRARLNRARLNYGMCAFLVSAIIGVITYQQVTLFNAAKKNNNKLLNELKSRQYTASYDKRKDTDIGDVNSLHLESRDNTNSTYGVNMIYRGFKQKNDQQPYKEMVYIYNIQGKITDPLKGGSTLANMVREDSKITGNYIGNELLFGVDKKSKEMYNQIFDNLAKIAAELENKEKEGCNIDITNAKPFTNIKPFYKHVKQVWRK